MKLKKTASGKTTVKMSRSEWTNFGKKAGWLKEAMEGETPESAAKRILESGSADRIAPDIHWVADGDPDALSQFQRYYPTWSIDDFKRCAAILEEAGY